MKDKKPDVQPALQEGEVKVVVAHSMKRLLAFSIDYLVIALAVQALLPLFLPDGWDDLSEEGLLGKLAPTYAVAAFLFLFKDHFQGRSVGKRLTNLYVASMQEDLPIAGAKQLLFRNLWLLILPVEAFKMVFDPYCRRYGDHYASTVVMERRYPPVVRRLTVKVIGVMMVISMLWSAYIYLTPVKIKKSHGYQIAREAALNDALVIQALGMNPEVSYWPEVSYEQGKEVFILKIIGPAKEERRVQVVMEHKEEHRRVMGVMLLEPQIKD